MTHLPYRKFSIYVGNSTHFKVFELNSPTFECGLYLEGSFKILGYGEESNYSNLAKSSKFAVTSIIYTLDVM